LTFSLIEQLQAGATDGSTPITDLLRKAKLAAYKLQSEDFAAWTEKELSGYSGVLDQNIPEYRNIAGEFKARNPFHGWQPVGLTTQTYMRHPIAQIEQIALNDSGYAVMGIPDDLAAEFRRRMNIPLDVRLHTPCASLFNIIDGVRNSVLDWSIKLERLGVVGHGLSFTPAEVQRAQAMSIQNHFHAPVAGFHQGTGTITGTTQNNSSATPEEMADALASLISALQSSPVALPAATTELAAVQKEVAAGRIPLARVRGILAGMKDAQDLAMRAPDLAQKIQALWQMFGG
jgi:fructose-specific phosphotransferase system component IIB